MGGGYVLNFSDKTFGEFFQSELNIDIDDQKYHLGPSPSKGNRLRNFWQVSDNALVGKSIEKLIAHIEAHILIGRLQKSDFPDDLVKRVQEIAARLSGTPKATANAVSEDEFLSEQFSNVTIDKVRLEPSISKVLNQRIGEIKRCITAKAALATIFLCSSTLEAFYSALRRQNLKTLINQPQAPKTLLAR